MTQPAVRITEIDGALGVLPPSAGRLHAIVGCSPYGPLNLPATYARTQDLRATYGDSGPLVEAAAYYIERYGRPVIVVRADDTPSPGTVGTITTDVAGTSVPSVAATPPAYAGDDLDVVVIFTTGGTVGTAGIQYQVSLDGGRTRSPVRVLGTANTLTVWEPGLQITFALAAGTVIAGDMLGVRTTAPNWDATTLAPALDALGNSAVQWEIVHVVGPIDADAFDVIELALGKMFAAGKYRAWVGNTRVPDEDESEAEYLAALTTELADKVTVCGELCAAACKLTSAVSGRKYRRPVSYAIGAREAASSEEIDIADVNLGTLPGVSIRDPNGNLDEHDESVNPGLDDLGFSVLRTWDGLQGVYSNRPRIRSPEGSDFQLMPHRRVMGLAEAALRQYFIRRLNKPILVDPNTGFILDSEALEIEAGARSALRSTLLAKPKASAVDFTLSRDDNVLSTKTLTGQARVTPLAYPEFIELDVGYFNPALAVQAA